MVAVSRHPASWSYMMKSAPAPANIWATPGEANSMIIGPNTGSPRASLSRTGLLRMGRRLSAMSGQQSGMGRGKLAGGFPAEASQPGSHGARPPVGADPQYFHRMLMLA